MLPVKYQIYKAVIFGGSKFNFTIAFLRETQRSREKYESKIFNISS